MRFSKSLLMMFAGLGLFACSNNDDIVKGGKIEGPADVVVKLNLPNAITRSVTTPSDGTNSGDKVDVSIDKIYVTLNAKKTETKEVSADALTVQFTDVEDPSSVVVSVNYDHRSGDYKFDFEEANTTYEGVKAPMFGTNSNFTPSEGKYAISVDVEHLLARMEFSGISHAHKDGQATCIFDDTKLKISGSFLKGVTPEVTSWDDFNTSSLWDKFEGSFKADGTKYPQDDECTSYNIEAGSCPTFTLAFDGVEYSKDYSDNNNNAIWTGNGHGYAYVSVYKITKGALADDELSKFEAQDNGDGTYTIGKFPAGYIYKVTDLTVPDEAIHPTIDGKGVIVEATVTILPWTVVMGDVEWKE